MLYSISLAGGTVDIRYVRKISVFPLIEETLKRLKSDTNKSDLCGADNK